MSKEDLHPEGDGELICRASITLPNGKTLIAQHYGLKAFCWRPKGPRKRTRKDVKK